MTRSAGAVLVGFVVLAVSLATKLWLVLTFLPEALPASGEEVFPHPGWLIAFLASDTALMILAGYVTTRLAPRAPIAHTVILGAVIVVLGLTWMLVFRGPLPLWYQVVLVSVAIPAAATGASLRGQVSGVSPP